MAKFYFNHATMNAGKSTILQQASHNYRERGMRTCLLTAKLDNRAGQGRIGSRTGIGAAADTFEQTDDLLNKIKDELGKGALACVLIDEAQFLTPAQVWQLARAADDLDVAITPFKWCCRPERIFCKNAAARIIGIQVPRVQAVRGMPIPRPDSPEHQPPCLGPAM